MLMKKEVDVGALEYQNMYTKKVYIAYQESEA